MENKEVKTMREIKFRAWNKKTHKMMENIGLNPLCEEICSDGDWSDDWSGYEIMQFTGLKDKNGKEIYDGDILGKDYPVGDLGKQKVLVSWVSYSSCFGLTPARPYDYSELTEEKALTYEIIGNIYESPELLEAHNGK